MGRSASQLNLIYDQEAHDRAYYDKIKYSIKRILEWYVYHNGNVIISFSGGIDSLVLLHLVRKIIFEEFGVVVDACFMDTGVEFPEIRFTVKSHKNVIILRPQVKGCSISYKDFVLKNGYFADKKLAGYPFWSKEVSMGIIRFRNTTDPIQKELRLYGGINPTSGREQKATIPKKFHRLAKEGTYPISHACFGYFKKSPAHLMYKKTGKPPYIGMKESDSDLRLRTLKRTGCNAYGATYPSSNPLRHWTDADVHRYVKENNLKVCELYNMDYLSSGCTGCTFGMAYDYDRFIRLKKYHLSIYNFYIYKCDYLGFFNEINKLCKRKDRRPFINF